MPRNDHRHKYCSVKCRHEGIEKGEFDTCLWCGVQFWKHFWAKKQDVHRVCSKACANEFYTYERSHAFKTGSHLHSDNGEKHILIKREGWVSKYIGEHRLNAIKSIGRMLTRREYVLRINRNPNDNRDENLFICDLTEFCHRRNGSLPWPDKSNLLTYAQENVNPPL